MDPLSITAGCVALISAVTKTSTVVVGFMKDVRAARDDLAVVSQELDVLKRILELLAHEIEDSDNEATIPENVHISRVIDSCSEVVANVEKCLGKYEGGKVGRAARWLASGKSDVAKLVPYSHRLSYVYGGRREREA